MWDPYSHIWKVDKDTFLEQYRQENHTAAEFDLLIINYNDLANTVQVQETVNQVIYLSCFLYCAILENVTYVTLLASNYFSALHVDPLLHFGVIER